MGFSPEESFLLAENACKIVWRPQVAKTNKKLSRHQVIGGLLALIVLALLFVGSWPLLFPK